MGPNYLVMEFIEGVSLAGPFPLKEAAEYAGQILDALQFQAISLATSLLRFGLLC